MADARVPVKGAEAQLGGVWRRFGGVDVLSTIAGLFTALGVLVFLAGLIGAGAAGIDYQLNLVQEGQLEDFALIGYVVALAVVFIAFFVGGWAAGRMARYDGGMNGLGVALWMLLLVVAFAALGVFLGEEYNAFAAMDLPNWAAQVDVEGADAMAWLSALGGVVVMFLAAWFGGMVGESYHHRVDAAIADAAVHST